MDVRKEANVELQVVFSVNRAVVWPVKWQKNSEKYPVIAVYKPN